MSGYPSDDSTGPSIPRGVLKSRGGWKGEELEFEHQREGLREPKERTAAAAVDLQQFRNDEVGKGYQAKHVIRQRSGKESSDLKVVDMSKSKDGVKTKRKHREKSSKESGDSKTGPRNKYLKSSGLRNFRKELEKIESSAA
jgi:hypothetical protein